MLAFKSSSAKAQSITPNLLPCKIYHDGKVDISQRHWDPKLEQNEKHAVYFRGRRLLGRKVPVPAGHAGAVLKITSDKIEKPKHEDEEEEEADVSEDTFAVEEVSTFDSVMIWNHETVPESSEDPYIKGVEEWIGMAEAIHASN